MMLAAQFDAPLAQRLDRHGLDRFRAGPLS